MKSYENILSDFRDFIGKNDNPYLNLKVFFNEEKELFYISKIKELQDQGLSEQEAVTKTRQSWVSTIGRSLELIVEELIRGFCDKNGLKITNDKVLKSKNLTKELDMLKRSLLVHFESYSVLPDGDIIIYKIKSSIPKVLAILSVKNSFRERYTETPYWKLKLKESDLTKHIKVFMITPDNDNEISFIASIKKSRIVMEYELDGIYLAKDDFDSSVKTKSIDNLIVDLEKLI